MQDEALITEGLARVLGLSVGPDGIAGELNDAPVSFAVRVQRYTRTGHALASGSFLAHDPDVDRLILRAIFPFWPPLDVGLRVAPTGLWSTLRAAGRDGFAGRFFVRDGDPARMDGLLTPGVREALDAAFVTDPGPSVTDRGVEWVAMYPRPWPEMSSLVEPILRVAAAWNGIWDAGRSIRPPKRCEEVSVCLAGLDLPQGVELRGSPCGLTGKVRSVRIGVHVAADPAGRFRTFVGIRFPQPLRGRAAVVRESEFGWTHRLQALLEGRSEISIGDAEFDRRFSVRADDPQALKAELDRGVREGMLALDAIVPIRLDPLGIWGTTEAGDLDLMARAVRGLLALAERF